MLLAVSALLAACSGSEGIYPEEEFQGSAQGVFVLCEGNFNSGNASLSYYDPEKRSVENGVFQRANDRKLGDTGQSITLHDGVAYVAVENSGIIWSIDAKTFRVRGQLTASQTEHMINPRYVHLVSDTKAYATDLYAPYITVFNPKTMSYTGSIATGQPSRFDYCNTERMVQWSHYLFVNCWCYSDVILVVDTRTDEVTDSIHLQTSFQPKDMVIDAHDNLWVITDGGYYTAQDSYGQNIPHLYRINAKTRRVELDLPLQTDEASVQLALNPSGTTLYIINNDIYRMNITDTRFPSKAFIQAPVDERGTLHKLYGISVNPRNGDIYVADAVDYAQSGVVYRYGADGQLIHQFRVGINPNGFAFGEASQTPLPPTDEDEEDNGEEEEEEWVYDPSLVSQVYEYMPAPGHQVNGYTVVGDFIHAGATMQEACDRVLHHFRVQHMVSLGGQGGYVIAGFDHDVTNSQKDYDLVIQGNPYSYQSEPGIVWVSQDENGDGLPNDTWYELAGSEYGTENHTTNYAITYYKPTTSQQDIRWTDNQGGSGIIPYMSAWNKHDSYWQDWVPVEDSPEGPCHTYYGSRLADHHTYVNGVTTEPPYAWGYADNKGSDCQGNLIRLKISNAVDQQGQPIHLPSIRFVKVQTAQTGYSPNLGEISTEVYGIWDNHLRKQ